MKHLFFAICLVTLMFSSKKIFKKNAFTLYKVVYLEWNSLGNWTKRIEYNEADWTGKLVTRKIKYFE